MNMGQNDTQSVQTRRSRRAVWAGISLISKDFIEHSWGILLDSSGGLLGILEICYPWELILYTTYSASREEWATDT